MTISHILLSSTKAVFTAVLHEWMKGKHTLLGTGTDLNQSQCRGWNLASSGLQALGHELHFPNNLEHTQFKQSPNQIRFWHLTPHCILDQEPLWITGCICTSWCCTDSIDTSNEDILTQGDIWTLVTIISTTISTNPIGTTFVFRKDFPKKHACQNLDGRNLIIFVPVNWPIFCTCKLFNWNNHNYYFLYGEKCVEWLFYTQVVLR